MLRLAKERTGDSSGAFALAMQRFEVPLDVSVALYAQLGRTVSIDGAPLPVRADDDLRIVYATALPDADNEFMDPDLREIVRIVAQQSGRLPPVESREIDDELGRLRTVRDLAGWIAALPVH